MEPAKGFLKNIFERESETPLSRRDALAGLGLAGVLLAAPKLLATTAAEAKVLDKPSEAADSAPVPETKASEDHSPDAGADDLNAAEAVDATDLSARRYWHRRYYWRRRYWGPYWRRRYWRRRYWRRRYW
jgi:hypothetical protein